MKEFKVETTCEVREVFSIWADSREDAEERLVEDGELVSYEVLDRNINNTDWAWV